MFENGKLDRRQAKLPERYEQPTLEHAIPGSAHWIDIHAIWIDEETKIWVHKSAPLSENNSGNDFPIEKYIRVIVVNEGLLVDFTSAKEGDGSDYLFTPMSMQDYVEDGDLLVGEFLPCIGAITNTSELDLVKKIFKKDYGVTLSGKAVAKTKQPKNKTGKAHSTTHEKKKV